MSGVHDCLCVCVQGCIHCTGVHLCECEYMCVCVRDFVFELVFSQAFVVCMIVLRASLDVFRVVRIRGVCVCVCMCVRVCVSMCMCVTTHHL